MFEIVKNRYRLIPYRSCGGTYYLHNNETGQRVSLETKDKHRATELLVAYNESAREPAFNLQKARIYMAASDPGVATRTWGKALESMIATKPAGSENQLRLERFAKEKALGQNCRRSKSTLGQTQRNKIGSGARSKT